MNKTKTITCPCGATSQAAKYGSVVEMERQSDFAHIPDFDGGATWLCPVCYITAHHLATQLKAVLGRDDFFFPRLLRAAS